MIRYIQIALWVGVVLVYGAIAAIILVGNSMIFKIMGG